MRNLFVVLAVVVGLAGDALAKGSLPNWVKASEKRPIAQVSCSKLSGRCYVDAWFLDVYSCQVAHMFDSALKRTIEISEWDWFDPTKQTFSVPVVVCRGKTGCSFSVSKLLCLDTDNRLVYEIKDASMFFEKPDPKRYEDYKK